MAWAVQECVGCDTVFRDKGHIDSCPICRCKVLHRYESVEEYVNRTVRLLHEVDGEEQEFTIPYTWLEKEVVSDFANSVKEFMETYTSVQSEILYGQAILDGVLVEENENGN